LLKSEIFSFDYVKSKQNIAYPLAKPLERNII